MTKKDIHVVPHKDGWATQKEGAGRAGSVSDTQKKPLSAPASRRSARRWKW